MTLALLALAALVGAFEWLIPPGPQSITARTATTALLIDTTRVASHGLAISHYDLAVTAAGDREVFVGTAGRSRVRRYLSGGDYDELTYYAAAQEDGPPEERRWRHVRGGRRLPPAGTGGFWVARGIGHRVAFPVPSHGRHPIVIRDAAGRAGPRVTLTLTAHRPGGRWASIAWLAAFFGLGTAAQRLLLPLR